MTDLLRQEVAASAETVVVKVGTRVVTHDSGSLHRARITRLAAELSEIRASGRKVVLVSSGAVGAGLRQLDLSQRPTDLARLQAVAAIGQTKLIEAYDRTFRKHGGCAAQVLLTADDLDNRTRYLNVRNTLISLLDLGAIPVINENDTVAVDELVVTFGDNDRLAALVANLLHASLLIILSDVDGLYDGDPRRPGARLIPTITRLDESVFAYVRDRATGRSRGGMGSKLEAAKMVTAAGENVIIASGRKRGVLADVMAGRPVGTLLAAQGKTISPWKRWIAFSAQPRGRITIDAGALRAISQQGRSLLAVGVLEAGGSFQKGDVVSLQDPSGGEAARGLTNYGRADLERIKGLRSDKIAQVLGCRPYEEVIHRDNMVVLNR